MYLLEKCYSLSVFILYNFLKFPTVFWNVLEILKCILKYQRKVADTSEDIQTVFSIH